MLLRFSYFSGTLRQVYFNDSPTTWNNHQRVKQTLTFDELSTHISVPKNQQNKLIKYCRHKNNENNLIPAKNPREIP